MIRALISDLFGTVTPKWSIRASNEAKASIADVVSVPAQAFIESWNATWLERETGRISLHESLSDALVRLEVEHDDALLARLAQMWMGEVRERMIPRNAAVTDTLRWCRTRGIKVGLVSNAGPAVPPTFQRSELAPLFDAALFSCEARFSKPDPRIFRQACELLGVRPGDCIYLGDGGDDELQGAERAGMMPVLLRDEAEVEREGLPSGAARWAGPVIGCYSEVRRHIEAPARRSADRRSGHIMDEWRPVGPAQEEAR